MPFAKIKKGKNKGKYRSPSGRIFTADQVKLYYATEGFTKKPKGRKNKSKKTTKMGKKKKGKKKK